MVGVAVGTNSTQELTSISQLLLPMMMMMMMMMIKIKRIIMTVPPRKPNPGTHIDISVHVVIKVLILNLRN